MNSAKLSMLNVPALALALAMTSCGPGEAKPDCVPVDEQLGVPGERRWCDGHFEPDELEWEGEPAVRGVPVCLAPLADGTCELCPTDAVAQAVEKQLLENLAMYQPMCKPDHWELGCMRTIENAISLGYESDYCCFQVALWGEGCKEQP